MENKNVGYLLLGISLLIIFIIFLFNNAMKNILIQSCPLEHGGVVCPAYSTITQQTYLSLAIVGVLILFSVFLILSKQNERIILKRIKERKKKIDFSNIDREEKKIVDLLLKEDGAMFQADLMEKLELGKVKMTRILDKLESKQVIERKRRGMTNIVVLR